MINIKAGWKALFIDPTCVEAFLPTERKARWEEWKRRALNAGEEELVARLEEPDAECRQCDCLSGDWCIFSDYPVNIDPVETIHHGVPGKGCGGVCFLPKKS